MDTRAGAGSMTAGVITVCLSGLLIEAAAVRDWNPLLQEIRQQQSVSDAAMRPGKDLDVSIGLFYPQVMAIECKIIVVSISCG